MLRRHGLRRFFALLAVLAAVFSSSPVSAGWFGKDKDGAKSGSQKTSSKTKATVYLKNGSSMTGIIAREENGNVTLDWDGSQIEFTSSEIARIDRGVKAEAGVSVAEKKSVWPHQNSPVIHLTNGTVVDGAISDSSAQTVTLAQDLGEGAFAYTDVNRDSIEWLEYAPVTGEETETLRAAVAASHPTMSPYDLGLAVLFTDSQGSSLKTLKSEIRDQLGVLAIEFHELVKGRKPATPLFLVVFDKMDDYSKQAESDGVPAWLCPGYFLPDKRTLYLVNYLGDSFTDMVYQTVSGGRRAIEQEANSVKGMVRKEYHGAIDGIKRDVDSKWESAIATLSSAFADCTLDTLRHEITHAYFHAFSLQSVDVSKNDAAAKEEADRTRKMSGADGKERKKMFAEILGVLRQKEPEFQASNSWFVEGTAEYMATTAIGRDNHRLYRLKQTKKKGELWPLEQLTVFKTGSFPGVTSEAALSAYAQSWSLTEFLMANHRKGFVAYLGRMAKEKASGNEDVNWLAEAVGIGPRELEKEWHAWIDAKPDVPDPDLERYMKVRDILSS